MPASSWMLDPIQVPFAARAVADAGLLLTLAHTLVAGDDCTDDVALPHAGATARVLGYHTVAASMVGTWLRQFTLGHVRQLDCVARPVLSRAWQAGVGPRRGDNDQGAAYVDTRQLARPPIEVCISKRPSRVPNPHCHRGTCDVGPPRHPLTSLPTPRMTVVGDDVLAIDSTDPWLRDLAGAAAATASTPGCPPPHPMRKRSGPKGAWWPGCGAAGMPCRRHVRSGEEGRRSHCGMERAIPGALPRRTKMSDGMGELTDSRRSH